MIPRALRFYPYFKRKEAKKVSSLIMKIAQTQGGLLLGLSTFQFLPKPKFRVSFTRLRVPGWQLRDWIFLSAELPYIKTDSEIAATVNHELGHYLQFRINKRASLLGNLTRFNEFKRFREGFAVFFQRIHSGFVIRDVMVDVRNVTSGKKLRAHDDWYARGYLRYLAIAKTRSSEHALRMGFEASVTEWLKAADEACQDLYSGADSQCV